MNESTRISQYKKLNEKLQNKITDTIVRHNIICNIIDNGDFEKVMNQ